MGQSAQRRTVLQESTESRSQYLIPAVLHVQNQCTHVSMALTDVSLYTQQLFTVASSVTVPFKYSNYENIH